MLSFFTLNGATVRASPVPTAVRDDDVYQAVVLALKATNEFDGVHYPSPAPEHGFGSGEVRTAVVVPGSGDEDSMFDDGRGPADVVRAVTYSVLIAVRDPDQITRAREFDRLANVTANALNGKSLAGATLPHLTRLRRSAVGRLTGPEQQITMSGTFSYFVDGWSAHDETV